MIKIVLIFLFSCVCVFSLQAQDFKIVTIAGDSVGYRGDGGPAIGCKLNSPEAVYLDTKGNLYVADIENGRIRKIELSTGIITTVAGNGALTYTGDNIPATNSELAVPVDVITDTAGNILIADALNNRIRKVSISTGIITTVAGNGTIGSTGDGGLATNAELYEPSGVCVDKAGNIYIADYLNNKIRKVSAATGIISTIAGTGTAGYLGDNGPATSAEFDQPDKVAVDTVGNILISDQWNHAVRKVNIATGIITTIAGNGTAGYTGNGGLAVNAKLSQPAGLTVDKQNNIYLAEYGNGVIRKIDGSTEIISTIVGNGIIGFSGDGGRATDAELWPAGVTLDSNGVIYIADYENNRIRMVYNTLAVKSVNNGKEITLYPNPASDELTVENAAKNILYIYDVIGREVYKSTITTDKERVNISGLVNGVYLVQMVDNITNNKVTKKVIKE